MIDEQQKLKVFLCHASENKPIVLGLYDRLKADGFDPWEDVVVVLAQLLKVNENDIRILEVIQGGIILKIEISK